MRYFPVFLNVSARRVVVVGGTEDAARKVRLLLKTDARIEVIAPRLHPALQAEPRVAWVSDVFLGDMLDGAALVFAADAQMNAQVAGQALARGIPINAVDAPALSSFIMPCIVDRDPVVVAIATEGAAPVLAQGLRAKVDALLPVDLGALTRRAADLRKIVAARLPAGVARRGFWRDFFFGHIAAARKAGGEVAYELALSDALFNRARSGKGRLSIIVAPGDPELITLKAQRHLMEADVIVTQDEGAVYLLEMARRDALRLDDLLQALALAKQGGNVVVITQQTQAVLRQAKTQAIAVEMLLHEPEVGLPLRASLDDVSL